MAGVLDHVGMQCTDMAASAAFYDAVLGPLGAQRIMDFGSAIGYGVPPHPDFWISAQETGDGFRESHIAFGAPAPRGMRPSSTWRWRTAPPCCTSPSTDPRTPQRTSLRRVRNRVRDGDNLGRSPASPRRQPPSAEQQAIAVPARGRCRPRATASHRWRAAPVPYRCSRASSAAMTATRPVRQARSSTAAYSSRTAAR